MKSETSAGPYSWYVAAVLMLGYVFAFLDRQILGLLVEPIKRDLGISDTAVSLLQGFSFALLMGLAGLPVGRLVDLRRRTAIIAGGGALWSAMTAAGGIAQSYGQLMLSRMGVGVGEACLTPAAYSLLADYFPARRRGLAFGLFGAGVYLGVGLSYVVGADVIRRIKGGGDLMLPLIGPLHAWQAAFLAAGLPGLAMAAWLSTLREPARQGSGSSAPLREVWLYFRAHGRAILLLDLCGAFAAMAAYSLSAWIPSLFIRTYGWSSVEIGFRYGTLVMATGVFGYLAGGWAGDLLVARRGATGRIQLIIAASLAALPLAAAAPLQADPWRVLALYGGATFLLTMAVGSGPAAQQSLVPPAMRGMAISLAVLVVNLVGLGLGPTAVALVTDRVLGNEAELRHALAATVPVMLGLAVMLGLFSLKPCARSLRQADAGR